MTKTAWIWIVVIIVIIGGLFLWMLQPAQPATDQTAQTGAVGATSSTTGDINGGMPTGTTTGAPMTATVTYDGNSFSPSSLTVAQGATVTFTDTAGDMWLASDPHPTHTAYDGTSRTQHCAQGYTGPAPLDECGSGSSFTFTFDKVGTFGYHDHMNDSVHGSVTVVSQ